MDFEVLKSRKNRSGGKGFLCMIDAFKLLLSSLLSIPTVLFTILQPHNQEIGKFYVAQVRRAPDQEALKLQKGRSGC